MEWKFKGRYINGKVELLEATDIEEGQEVLVYVPLIRRRKKKSFMSTSGAWKDDAEYWDAFLQTLYKDGRRRNFLEND